MKNYKQFINEDNEYRSSNVLKQGTSFTFTIGMHNTGNEIITNDIKDNVITELKKYSFIGDDDDYFIRNKYNFCDAWKIDMHYYYFLYIDVSFIFFDSVKNNDRPYDIRPKEFLKVGLENIQTYFAAKKYNVI
jgi:hypothetical protein